MAFAARPAGMRRTQVFARDVDGGAAQLVSRADGAAGAPGQGAAVHPAISGDGTKVAFTSDAWNLSADKCNSARGVFVRDLRRGAHAAGERRRRGQPLHRADEGLEHRRRRVRDDALRVTLRQRRQAAGSGWARRSRSESGTTRQNA